MSIFCPNGHENPDNNRFCQSCGERIIVSVSHEPISTGVLLGERYRITKEIGRGGFGRTYLCEDINRFNELCVLKEFAPQVQSSVFLLKAQELFEREAGVMYRFQHPQIPMFREMFRVNRGDIGQLFLVQDYVAGVNYQQLLRQKLTQGKTFTEIEIIELLTQILPVLSYIHSLGVIHRDISPDNLIRRERDGLPVLIDFGGVKQVAVNAAAQYLLEQNNHLSTRLGKVGYAPNEQLQRGVVFHHSDLYALAATSLVLLTGREPQDLIDPQNFSWNWRAQIDLSTNLGSILDRMLQLRPQDRFQSAQDILTALKSGNLSSSSPSIQPPAPIILPLPAAILPVTAASNESPPPVPVKITSQPPPPAIPTIIRTEPSLLKVIGKTWLFLAAVIGAIGFGWIVASLTAPKKLRDVRPVAGMIWQTTQPQYLRGDSHSENRYE
jgi:serine/threonine protein kinase, bacterial